MSAAAVTKPGRYGTLFRFVVEYRDKDDDACPTFTQSVWAYDATHAEDAFYDAADADGWKVVRVRKLTAERAAPRRGRA